MATGCLSSANTPDFPGIDTFEGPLYHTALALTKAFHGQRVGIIGTGSSAIQSIPSSQGKRSLTVFQRTPN